MTNSNGLARFSRYALRAFALTAVSAFLLVQNSVAQSGGDHWGANSDTDTRSYDKRDFNGLYARNPAPLGLPACPECGRNGPISYGFFGDVPPMTPEGQRRFEANRPTKGWPIGSEAADAHSDEHIAYRRANESVFANDPEERCEPLGLIRMVTFSGGNAPMQIVQTDDIIVQEFEWFWDHREIWLDGRELPDVRDYLPRFMGFSVGEWEGDTLVVTTVGFDDRQWVDAFGFPISEEAVLVERYSRPSPNRLRVDMTLTDPLTYTRPWHASPKVWTLIPKENMAIGGWSGLAEDYCVPSDNDYYLSFGEEAAGVGEVPESHPDEGR